MSDYTDTVGGSDRYNREQAAIDLARQALEDNVAAMAKAANTVRQIHDDVRISYVAASATSFTNKLEEWLDVYNTVKQRVDSLHQALTAADQTHNTGEMDAQQYSAAWSPSGGTFTDEGESAYAALSGK
ncbi:hypothetical protein [Streptomyces sp. NPDC060198]|uniref:hypothetical protein n=1 Tax=Streptomyces sp. NPDC060198 TaxID=3347070 RepID=UPI00365A93C0